MQQLDGVRVAQLMGRESAPDPCLEREVVQLDPCGAGRPRTPAGRTVDHAEQRFDRKLHPLGEPRLDRRPRARVHADLRAVT